MFVSQLRAGARDFFIDSEQQANLVDASSAKLFGRSNLRRDDSFGIARAASMDEFIVFARRDERRHRVHVRREHNTWSGFRGGDDIRSFVFYVLQLNMISKSNQQFA